MARKIPRHSDELLPREDGFFYSFNAGFIGVKRSGPKQNVALVEANAACIGVKRSAQN